MSTKKNPWENLPLALGLGGMLFDIIIALYFHLSDKLISYHSTGLTSFDVILIGTWGILNYPAILSTEWAFNLTFDVYNTYTPPVIFFAYYLALCIPLFGVNYALGCIIKFIRAGKQMKKCLGILALVLTTMIAVDGGLRLILADKLADLDAQIDTAKHNVPGSSR
jgi:hypothetical protein